MLVVRSGVPNAPQGARTHHKHGGMRRCSGAEEACASGYVGVVRLALVAVIMGLAAGLLARGSLRNLGRTRFRHAWLLGLYVAGTVAARLELRWSLALMLVGMAAFVAFAVSNALPVPGMAVVGLGLLLNLVVTANNGGMPYRPSAVVAAGVVSSKSADLVPKNGVAQHAERASDQLMFLADVIPIRVLREVVSVGDILVALGLGLVAFNAISSPEPGGHSFNKVRGASKPTVITRINSMPLTSTTSGQSGGSALHEDDWGAWQGKVIDLTTPAAVKAKVPEDPSEPSFDEWDHRIALLRATGDITVVVDLASLGETEGIDEPNDEHGLTARLVVARALQSANLRVHTESEDV